MAKVAKVAKVKTPKVAKEPNEEKKLSPFDILNDLNRKVLHTEAEVKEAGLNIYLLLMFIKNHNIGIHIANYLNENWRIPFYDMYLFVFMTFKQFNVSGVRWIKSDKGIKVEYAEIVQRYYMCSYLTALEYLRVLPDTELKRIIDLYKTGGRSDN